MSVCLKTLGWLSVCLKTRGGVGWLSVCLKTLGTGWSWLVECLFKNTWHGVEWVG